MCLLDCVEHWDGASIVCTTRTHLDPNNPLRNRGRLSAVCAVEYAAQAMAVHGALSSSMPSVAGYLISVRALRLTVQRMDDVRGPLEITATRIMGDGDSATYEFIMRADSAELLNGRASVFLGKPGGQQCERRW